MLKNLCACSAKGKLNKPKVCRDLFVYIHMYIYLMNLVCKLIFCAFIYISLFLISVQASLCINGMCHRTIECDNLPRFNCPVLYSVSHTEASCGQ